MASATSCAAVMDKNGQYRKHATRPDITHTLEDFEKFNVNSIAKNFVTVYYSSWLASADCPSLDEMHALFYREGSCFSVGIQGSGQDGTSVRLQAQGPKAISGAIASCLQGKARVLGPVDCSANFLDIAGQGKSAIMLHLTGTLILKDEERSFTHAVVLGPAATSLGYYIASESLQIRASLEKLPRKISTGSGGVVPLTAIKVADLDAASIKTALGLQVPLAPVRSSSISRPTSPEIAELKPRRESNSACDSSSQTSSAANAASSPDTASTILTPAPSSPIPISSTLVVTPSKPVSVKTSLTTIPTNKPLPTIPTRNIPVNRSAPIFTPTKVAGNKPTTTPPRVGETQQRQQQQPVVVATRKPSQQVAPSPTPAVVPAASPVVVAVAAASTVVVSAAAAAAEKALGGSMPAAGSVAPAKVVAPPREAGALRQMVPTRRVPAPVPPTGCGVVVTNLTGALPQFASGYLPKKKLVENHLVNAFEAYGALDWGRDGVQLVMRDEIPEVAYVMFKTLEGRDSAVKNSGRYLHGSRVKIQCLRNPGEAAPVCAAAASSDTAGSDIALVNKKHTHHRSNKPGSSRRKPA